MGLARNVIAKFEQKKNDLVFEEENAWQLLLIEQLDNGNCKYKKYWG